mgnify:CR=1 FL=1
MDAVGSGETDHLSNSWQALSQRCWPFGYGTVLRVTVHSVGIGPPENNVEFSEDYASFRTFKVADGGNPAPKLLIPSE